MSLLKLITPPVNNVWHVTSAQVALSYWTKDSGGHLFLGQECAGVEEFDGVVDFLHDQLENARRDGHRYFDQETKARVKDYERRLRHESDPSQPCTWHNLAGRFGDLSVETDHGLVPEVATVSDYYLMFRCPAGCDQNCSIVCGGNEFVSGGYRAFYIALECPKCRQVFAYALDVEKEHRGSKRSFWTEGENPQRRWPSVTVEHGHDLLFHCPDGCDHRCTLRFGHYEQTCEKSDQNLCIVLQCNECGKKYQYKIWQGPYTSHPYWGSSWTEQVEEHRRS